MLTSVSFFAYMSNRIIMCLFLMTWQLFLVLKNYMSANTPLTSCQVLSSDCHCFKPAIVFSAIARSGQYFHLPPPWVSTPTHPPCHLHRQCLDPIPTTPILLTAHFLFGPKNKSQKPNYFLFLRILFYNVY